MGPGVPLGRRPRWAWPPRYCAAASIPSAPSRRRGRRWDFRVWRRRAGERRRLSGGRQVSGDPRVGWAAPDQGLGPHPGPDLRADGTVALSWRRGVAGLAAGEARPKEAGASRRPASAAQPQVKIKGRGRGSVVKRPWVPSSYGARAGGGGVCGGPLRQQAVPGPWRWFPAVLPSLLQSPPTLLLQLFVAPSWTLELSP